MTLHKLNWKEVVMKLFSKYRFAALMLLANFFIALSTAQGGTFADNFNDNRINSKYWWAVINGVGPTVEETNQRLEVSIPSTAILNGGLVFSAGLSGTYELIGDFDAQVDFDLINWPNTNGMKLGLATILGNVVLQRTSSRPGVGQPREYYILTFFRGVATFDIDTTDTSGKLRLKRTGNTVEGFYWKSNSWELLGSYSHPSLSDPTDLIMVLSHGNGWLNESVKAAFDNFKITNNQFSASRLGFLNILLTD
jgi:hypothetical protein